MVTRRQFLGVLAAGIAGLAVGLGVGSLIYQQPTQVQQAKPAPQQPLTAKRRVRALWIYVGPIGDLGWTHAHDQGRKYVDDLYPWLETVYIEKVSEEQAKTVIESQLTTEHYDAVFATSYGFMYAIKELAPDFPDVKFYHCSGPWEEFKDLPNVVTYFAEFYQLYYLNGLAAGAVTQTCRVGYVPAFLIPEVVRHINAFVIGAIEGAKLVGKCGNGEKLEAYVTAPLGAWFAPDKARNYAAILVEKYDVDVIAFTEDSTAILELAESYWEQGLKVYSFSHYSNMYEYFLRQGRRLRSHLTGQVADWGPIYAYLLAKLYAGAFEKEDVWARLGDFTPIRWTRPLEESKAGEREGAVYLAPLNTEAIPPKALEVIKRRYEEMRELLFEPFTGPIRGYSIDAEGRPQEEAKLKVEPGRRLGRNELWTMMWFHERIVSLAG
jgi:simple sugar transport system substrate-binding protein